MTAAELDAARGLMARIAAGKGKAKKPGINAPLPPPREKPGTPSRRWAELHARSRLPVADVDAERAWIGKLAVGITCSCNEHWQTHLAANPPTIDTPERYEAWAVAAHNGVNRRLGRPELTIEQARAAQGLHVHNSAAGLGDAISGLYAVCGLADATGLPITYHSHSASWLACASHPGVRIERIEDGSVGVDLNGGSEGYGRSIASAATRTQGYCDNVAAAYGLPSFAPRRPAVIHGTRRQAVEPYVVLAPFSAYDSRSWPAAKWTELAMALHARGIGVVAIGSAGQGHALAETFGSTYASWSYGQSPEHSIGLMLAARCVVANDSGIAHLGGLLNVPTVAVHAGSLPHGYLFDLAPSVTSVTAGKPLSRSDHAPAALAAIDVGVVLAAVLAV